MSLMGEFKDLSQLEGKLEVSVNGSSPISLEDLVLQLGQASFSQDECQLHQHSEIIANNTTLLQTYIDVVLASRNVHDDPVQDHMNITAASNAISILNYGSRSGIFPFRFIDIRDWSGIRVPGANLNYAMMSHCILDNADLSGSSMKNITLMKAHLRRTNLSGVKVYEATVLHTRPDPSCHTKHGYENLAVHPNGFIAVSGDSDGRIRVFNLEADVDVCYLDGHTSDITSLDFNRNGDYLGSVSDDHTIRVWNMANYQCAAVIQLNSSKWVIADNVSFSPDSSKIAVICRYGTIGIWNLETSEWTMTLEQEQVDHVEWHPYDSRILAYSDDGDMGIWDVETGLCITKWHYEISSHRLRAKFTLDGNKVLVNLSGKVAIRDATSGECILELPKDECIESNFAVDSHYMYVPSGRWINVFDLETYQCVAKFRDQPTAFTLFPTADGQRLIANCTDDCIIKLYDMTSLKLCAPTVAKGGQDPYYHSFAFSPDNRTLAAGYYGSDGDMRFLDTLTGRCIKTIDAGSRSHTETHFLRYSPDGRFIAFVPHLSHGIIVYNISEAKPILLQGHNSPIGDIAFAPNGRLLASSGIDCHNKREDGKILLWDTETWTSRVLRGHTSEVLHMCFNPAGNILVSVSGDRTIRMWNVVTDQCIRVIGDEWAGNYTSVTFSPCDRFFATVQPGRRIRIWNAKTGTLISTFNERPGEYVYGRIKFLPNGQLISISDKYSIIDIFTGKRADLPFEAAEREACISFDSSLMVRKASPDSQASLYIWQFPGSSWKTQVLFQPSEVTKASPIIQVLDGLSDKGNIAIASDQDGTIQVYHGSMGNTVSELQGHVDVITCMHASSNGMYLVSGSRDATLRIWNLETNSCITTKRDGHSGAITCVQFSPDNQLIASGSYDTTIQLWNVSDCKCLGQFDGHTGPIKQIKFFPNNNNMIASIGSNDHVICIWDIVTSSCSMVLDQHIAEIFDIQFSADGHYMASGSHDDTIRVWDLHTGECIAMVKGHSDCLTCFAFSLDGTTIVSGSEDNTLRIWNVSTGECSLVICGHTGHIRSLCLTPDSQCVISASNDHVIHIWDMKTGSMLHQLLGHTDVITSIKLLHYDPEKESMLASTSSDGTVRVWTVTNMPSHIPLLPEMCGMIGAQESMILKDADLTDAIMDNSFVQVVAQCSQEEEEDEDDYASEYEYGSDDEDYDENQDQDQNEDEDQDEDSMQNEDNDEP